MKNECIVVKGLITPTGWDKNDNVVAIALASFDEDEYLIDKDKTGMKLLSFLRAKVQLSGIVRSEKGIKRIKVKEYTLLNRTDFSRLDQDDPSQRSVKRCPVRYTQDLPSRIKK